MVLWYVVCGIVAQIVVLCFNEIGISNQTLLPILSAIGNIIRGTYMAKSMHIDTK